MQKVAGDHIIFVDPDEWVSEGLCETIKNVSRLCGGCCLKGLKSKKEQL